MTQLLIVCGCFFLFVGLGALPKWISFRRFLVWQRRLWHVEHDYSVKRFARLRAATPAQRETEEM
jgi:hypothetical protein